MEFLQIFFYETPFHYAVESDDFEIVDFLIKEEKIDKKLLFNKDTFFYDLYLWITSDEMKDHLLQYFRSFNE